MKLRAHHQRLLARRTNTPGLVWWWPVVVVEMQTKPFGLISLRLGVVGYALSPDSCYLFASFCVQYGTVDSLPHPGRAHQPDRHRI